MKKVFISIGIVLVIAGIIIVAVFGGAEALKSLAGVPLGKHNLEAATEQYGFEVNAAEDLRKITVKSFTYSVYLVPSQSNFVTVKYISPLPTPREFIEANYNKETNVLEIRQDQNDGSGSFLSINRKLQSADRFIVIELPQTVSAGKLDVDINIDYGGASVENLAFSSVVCNVSVGGMLMKDCTAFSVNATSNTGGINVSGSEVSSLILKSKTGSVGVDGVKCESFNADVNTGSVKIEKTAATSIWAKSSTGSIVCNADCKTLTLKSNTGSVNFNSDAEIIKIEANTGSVKGVVQGAKADYDIRVEKDTGSSNIGNQTAGTGKLLDVKVNTGSINISFES